MTLRFLLLPLPLLLLFSACRKDEAAAPADAGPIRRTVLVYMVAQNSMGDQRQQAKDSAELMRGVAALAPDDRLLVYIDDDAPPRLYLFSPQESAPRTVRLWSEDVNSASPDVLADVLAWTARHYPAGEYGLVMWSHATGWLPSTNKSYASPLSFGIDTGPGGRGDKLADGRTDGAQMDVDDMAAAIASTGLKMRYIFFDACLMQSVETCYALRHATDYVVASPISTPMAGAFYTRQLGSGLFSDDPADIARTYYEDVRDTSRADDYGDFGIVVSAVRTDRMEELARAVADALPASGLTERRSPDMTGVQKYAIYDYSHGYRPHNYDAACALRALLPEAGFARVKEALDEAVAYKAATERFYVGGRATYERTDMENYCGLAMFVPQAAYTANAERCAYGDLNEAFRQTAWHEAAGWAATGW